MTRRSPDPIALVFGAVFVAIGVVAIAGRVDLFATSQWLWPAVLVGVGIIMLAGMVGRRPRRPEASAPVSPATGAPGAEEPPGE